MFRLWFGALLAAWRNRDYRPEGFQLRGSSSSMRPAGCMLIRRQDVTQAGDGSIPQSLQLAARL
jgi:hypothetical protein